MPEPQRHGTLAADLRDSERSLRSAESRVEAFLTTLFPAWRGWVFTSPAGIDVYSVTETSAAVQALFRQGFVTVTLHHHQAERFITCKCVPREAPL